LISLLCLFFFVPSFAEPEGTEAEVLKPRFSIDVVIPETVFGFLPPRSSCPNGDFKVHLPCGEQLVGHTSPFSEVFRYVCLFGFWTTFDTNMFVRSCRRKALFAYSSGWGLAGAQVRLGFDGGPGTFFFCLF